MVADRQRALAYARALEAAVETGSVVADIGTGSGILAILACRAGAARVYAMDNAAILLKARELAVANGVEDRIVFLEAEASTVSLPEKVDLMVSDLRGTLPLSGRHPELIAELAARWLADDGAVIPRRDVVWAAPCHHPEALHLRLDPGLSPPLELAPLRQAALNHWWRRDLPISALLAPPQPWAELDYPCAARHRRRLLSWTVAESVETHGLAVWFESELWYGVALSAGPGCRQSAYGQGFFPWPQAVELAAGDSIRVDLRADRVGDRYVWSWDSAFEGGGGELLRFEQTTFAGALIGRRVSPSGTVPSVGIAAGRQLDQHQVEEHAEDDGEHDAIAEE